MGVGYNMVDMLALLNKTLRFRRGGTMRVSAAEYEQLKVWAVEFPAILTRCEIVVS